MLRLEIDINRVGGWATLEAGKLETSLHIHREGKLAQLKYGRRYWLFFSQSPRHIHLRLDKREWNWHADWLGKFRRVDKRGLPLSAD